MTIHRNVRPVDRRRAVAALDAWVHEDPTALRSVLDQAYDDDHGMTGLLYGLLDHAALATAIAAPHIPQPGDLPPNVRLKATPDPDGPVQARQPWDDEDDPADPGGPEQG